MCVTHHSPSVSLHELDDASRVFVPQVDVSAVTAADHELAARPVEVHPLHCEEEHSVSQPSRQHKLSLSGDRDGLCQRVPGTGLRSFILLSDVGFTRPPRSPEATRKEAAWFVFFFGF